MWLIRKMSLQRSNYGEGAGFAKIGARQYRQSRAAFVPNAVSVCTSQTCRRARCGEACFSTAFLLYSGGREIDADLSLWLFMERRRGAGVEA
jgi:hypothetical protein